MENFARAKPLVSDYISRRKTPLRVDIYKGSVASSGDCLLDVDAVIAIELIEHLYPDELNNVPYNVFGYIRPKLAIFSTPNFDYNPVFNLVLSNSFRNQDHKFEWTRKQFEDWCYNICCRFPNYTVTLMGVGEPPAWKNNVGHVTQIGIFIRNDIRKIVLHEDIFSPAENPVGTKEYELLYSVDFPTMKDERTRDEKLLDDIKYHINRYINIRKYFNTEFQRHEIPIDNILEFMHPKIATVEELQKFLLRNNYEMDCNNQVLVQQISDAADNGSDLSSSSKSIEDMPISRTSDEDLIEKWD